MLRSDEEPYLPLPFPTEGTPNLICLRSARHGSQYRRPVNADLAFLWSVDRARVRHFGPLLLENHNLLNGLR